MGTPLVSCVMPTANRRTWVRLAIGYFLRQDYANRELVIVDDGRQDIADLMPDDARVRHIRLNGKRTLGAKRNECVKASRGELIMHWDDDDWMAPNRITVQMEALLASGREVCGLRRMLFYDPAGKGGAWLYEYPQNQRPWLAGGSLLYTRDFWKRAPFPDIQVGSDTRFMWDRRNERVAEISDYSFYVALIHPGNTSPKRRSGGFWRPVPVERVQRVMGDDWTHYQQPRGEVQNDVPAPKKTASTSPTYAILMAVHNALEMCQLSTTRTLRYSAGESARLIVVDNASTDGVREWLEGLARRGDIDLIRSSSNIGHGPALELARARTKAPYLVALDSDAFPLCNDWLAALRSRLDEGAEAAGILHHRGYIHPSCLIVRAKTLDDYGLTFLNEKHQPSRLDVAERISLEILKRGGRIAGLERTRAQMRGSVSEPVWLGAEYEGIVWHQWYTTRATLTSGGVDDVPARALRQSLERVLGEYHAERRELAVIVGIRARGDQPQRVRNAVACLRSLNDQDLERWRYRIIVVEQDEKPRLDRIVSPLSDKYLFLPDSGPYNRSRAFNAGAAAANADVLCLIDADLLPAPIFLRSGLDAIVSGEQAVLPYEEVFYLDKPSTEIAIRARRDRPRDAVPESGLTGTKFDSSQGGCFWIDAGLYREIGGHDERFKGWGREDREFYDRVSQRVAIGRMQGRLLHLDHPRPAMMDAAARANQQLYRALKKQTVMPEPPPAAMATNAADAGIPGQRDWEGWHRWTAARILKIVADERSLTRQGVSARSHLAKLLSRLGRSVLDVGCGPGSLWLHADPSRQRWVGIDVTWPMISAAHQSFPKLPVTCADAGHLPFEDGAFDVVVLRHVLEYLPDWLMQRTVAESARVARRYVVIAFHIPPEANRARASMRTVDGFVETRWSVSDIEAATRAAGWVVQSRRRITSDEIWTLTPPPAVTFSGPAPKISVIMPTYKRDHTLGRTVATILAQTWKDWELIIVDNSGDSRTAFRDPRIRIYRHAERPSSSYARNQGLRYATGDLVCFFDDDDEMYPEYLATFATVFAANAALKMARCGMLVSNGSINFTYATPECCIRREFATPTWESGGYGQDQRYFKRIVRKNSWSETKGDIVRIHEVLCRALTDSRGGLRVGAL